MSYIKAGGTCVGCPSLIGNTAGGGGGTTGLGYFSQEFFEAQYFNSMFWNRRSTPASHGTYFGQEFWHAEFWNSKFWNRL